MAAVTLAIDGRGCHLLLLAIPNISYFTHVKRACSMTLMLIELYYDEDPNVKLCTLLLNGLRWLPFTWKQQKCVKKVFQTELNITETVTM